MAKSHLEADPAAWDRTAKGVDYAQDLLKAEGGDPKVVLATVLLHRVAPDKAREFLAELETEPEIVEAVLELLAGQGAERDLNRQIFQDVLALLEEKTGSTPAVRHPHGPAPGRHQAVILLRWPRCAWTRDRERSCDCQTLGRQAALPPVVQAEAGTLAIT